MNRTNLILLGTQKAGTTSLYSWIIQHPNITGNMVIKDIPVYMDEVNRKLEPSELDDMYKNDKTYDYYFHGWVHYISNLDEFFKYFEVTRNKKFIIVLRDPVERAISNFNYSRSLGFENSNSFLQTLKSHNEGKNNLDFNLKGYLSYIDNSLYSENIGKILKHVSKENLLVLWFNDLENQPQETISSVFKFLNLKKTSVDLKKENITRELKYPILFKAWKVSLRLIPNYLKEFIPLHKRDKIRKKAHHILSSKLKFNSNIKHFEKVRIYNNLFQEDALKLEQLGYRPYWKNRYQK